MATDRTAAIVPTLGDLCTVEVDGNWPYKDFWEAEAAPIGLKLSFAFVDLETGFAESSPPNYATTEVIGRAEQYQTYMNTGNREIGLTFRFQAQGLPTTGDQADIAAVCLREVVEPANWLDALQHPVVAPDKLSHGPPPVILTVGRLLKARCIVTQASPTWKEPFDPETLLPLAAEVQVTFVVVRTKILDTLFRHRRKYI